MRRFADTRRTFPHLINAGKYSATVLMYTMLSLWRIHEDERYKALFIFFASINTLYCCKLLAVLADDSLVGSSYGLVVDAT
jgi:xenotropic and polytropic retrovirus receptor 1